MTGGEGGSGSAGGEGTRGGGGGVRGDVVARGVDRISHQLKNPLQTISVNLEVLRLRAVRGAPAAAEEIDRLAEVVEGGVRTLDRRIGMLVDLARRSTGEGWRRVSLGSYVRDASATFQLDERESGRGLRVEVPPPEEDGEVRVRPGWLLAALLEVADRPPAEGEGDAVVRVTLDEDGGLLELPAPPGGAGEAVEALRRAGGETSRAGDRIRVLFPTG